MTFLAFVVAVWSALTLLVLTVVVALCRAAHQQDGGDVAATADGPEVRTRLAVGTGPHIRGSQPRRRREVATHAG